MAKQEEEDWDYQWDTEDVAAYLKIKTNSLRRQRLRPGFMPEPDGYISRSPWWWASVIKEWDKDRPARGWQGHKTKVGA